MNIKDLTNNIASAPNKLMKAVAQAPSQLSKAVASAAQDVLSLSDRAGRGLSDSTKLVADQSQNLKNFAIKNGTSQNRELRP